MGEISGLRIEFGVDFHTTKVFWHNELLGGISHIDTEIDTNGTQTCWIAVYNAKSPAWECFLRDKPAWVTVHLITV